MSKNKKVWNVPEGYELDKEQSSETKVVLKKIGYKRVNSWKDYCKIMKGKNSCYVDANDNIRSTNFSSTAVVGEFEDKDDAVAFAALHKLISLRKNWIDGWEPNWKDLSWKYTITTFEDKVVIGTSKYNGFSMSFPTHEMRTLFFDTFRDLLEQAKPLL